MIMSKTKEIYNLKQLKSEFSIWAARDCIELGADQDRGNYNWDSTLVVLNKEQALELASSIFGHFKYHSRPQGIITFK